MQTWTRERIGLSEGVRVDRLVEEPDEIRMRMMVRMEREKSAALAAT